MKAIENYNLVGYNEVEKENSPSPDGDRREKNWRKSRAESAIFTSLIWEDSLETSLPSPASWT